MYAVISAGGKQYAVKEGEKLRIEKVSGNVGEEVTFSEVLLVGDNGAPKIGTPHVAGANVVAKIKAQDRDRKIIVYKKKRRKGYEKRFGHRQSYTEVEIVKISY